MTRLLFACVLLLSSSAALAATTFKIATIAPNGTTWMKAMHAANERIQEGTEGRVALKFYPGGVMGSAETVLKKMRVGQLHGAALTSGDLGKVVKDAQLYNLPFLFNAYDEVRYVRERMDDDLKKSFDGSGLTIASISSGGFAYFMSAEPVLELKDIQARKTWIPEGDDFSAVTYDNMGITPIPLGIADTFTGLQTGLIDTVPTTFMGAVAFQWYTKLKYVTDVPSVYVSGMMALSDRQLKKLSDADRQVLMNELNTSFAELDKQNEIDEAKAAKALKNQGLEFLQPNAEQMQQWTDVATRSREQLIQSYGLSAELTNKMLGLLADYRKP